MTKPWTRFLLLQFPVAALMLALIAEAVSWTLSGVPMRRDRADELALAVSHDPANYRTILLGDSITRDATSRFSLSEPGDVANLATNAHVGIAGELLLLRRYLNAHSSPKYVVLVLAPAMYGAAIDIRIVRYNLWRTFREPDERGFLKTYLPDIDQDDWLPAAADLQGRVVEPFFSWLKGRYLAFRRHEAAHIPSGSLDPDPDAATAASVVVQSALDDAISEGFPAVPTPVNTAALSQICQLSKQHGFRVKLAWPPMIPEIKNAAMANGTWRELERHIRDIMANCHIEEITDFSRIRSYTAASFHRDMTHLYGEGWQQRYASDLRKYLQELPD
jgi:hypothetical protein